MAFELQSGVNASHWLSQSRKRGEERRAAFVKADVERIAALGFCHVRLPVDEEHLFTEAGKPDAEGFDLLQQGLDWCRACDLRVIVDLHILRSHHFNQAETPALYTDPAVAQYFASLWDQLSQQLAGRSADWVAYELLNEPVARDPQDWNRVFRLPLAAIRKREPHRKVVLGSNWYQTVDMFRVLDIPADDELILSFHFYDPMFITHYRASWTPIGDYDGPVNYPGVPVAEVDVPRAIAAIKGERVDMAVWNRSMDPKAMAARLEHPLAARKRTGLPLYCGEFGVIALAPAEIRRAWICDFVSVLRAHDIGFGVWDYRGSFGLFDAADQPTPVLEGLRSFLGR